MSVGVVWQYDYKRLKYAYDSYIIWFCIRLNCVARLCTCSSVQSEKLQSLTANLVEKKKRKGVSFRGIVFVQQRISAYVLSKYLNDNSACMDCGLRSG